MKRSFLIALVFGAVLFTAEYSYSSAYSDYLNSIVNPHQQISDEGNILWNKCLICHTEVPDIDRARGIEDVGLYYEGDLKDLCFQCHRDPPHPGGGFFGKAGEVPPDHLLEVPDYIRTNIRLSSKESFMILPIEPSTDKMFCGTCHNPHERGLLKGRSDVGADMRVRLRSGGRTICQFCHRK